MSYGARSIASELAKLVDKRITVRLVDGKTYTGKLVSFDSNSLHIVLSDAESSDGLKFHRVIISGSRLSELLVQEQPLFIAEEFASLIISRLGLRPDLVKIVPESNSVIIYDKYRVSEAGVEGTGSFAQKLYEIYTEYIESRKKGAK